MRVLEKGIDSQPSFVPRVGRLPNVSGLVLSAGTGAAMEVVVRRSSSALEVKMLEFPLEFLGN